MSEDKRIFGLKKNVFWLGIVSLINDFSSEMVYSIMPAFLTIVLGAPAVLVGFLEGLADALASVLKIYFGWWSDKIGKRKSIAVSGYSLSVATRWFLALVGSFWQVLLLRAIDRVGKGMRDAPRDALISESVERSELGKSFGYHRAMDTVGAMLGPLTAAFLLPLFLNNYRLIFQVAFFAGIFAILSFIFVKDVPKKEPAIKPAAVPLIFSLKGFSRDFKMYALSIFIFGLGIMPVGLILLKSQEVGQGGSFMPLVYFISSLTFVLAAIPAGKLSDRIGERKVILLGFLAGILAYAILAYFSTPLSVVAGFVLFGLYSALTDGIQRALASKLVAREQLATGQGFLNSAIGISSLLAGIIGGLIWTNLGAAFAFGYGIILMLIGLLTFIRFSGSHKEI